MKQILWSDWLPECPHRARLGFSVLVPLEKSSLFGRTKSTLLTKLVCSRKLDIGLVPFSVFIDLNLASVHNIQPS